MHYQAAELPVANSVVMPLLCREKLSKLRNTGDPIFFRVSELQARPEAVQLARQFAQLTTQSVTGWATSKPWMNATDSQNLLAEVRLHFAISCTPAL